MIDSIQTMYLDTLDSAPGTVAQVRAPAAELIRLAKRRGFVLMLVGHVTKDGQIAGPRVLEHMVDTVLYFEGERGHQFRILRAVKNRFGPTDEIGVFEMTDRRPAGGAQPLRPVPRRAARQRLAAPPCSPASRARARCWSRSRRWSRPRRSPRRGAPWSAGIRSRLAMVLAVLETRCGLAFAGNDVYLNVAGGLRIGEPAADLAVAAALISSLTDRPVPEDVVVFGEIGLSGEVRMVAQPELRLREAAQARLPPGPDAAPAPMPRRNAAPSPGIEVLEIGHLQDVLDWLYNEVRSLSAGKRGPRSQ